MRSVDLDTLTGNAGEVKLGGIAYAVLPLDGAAYKSLLRMREGQMGEEDAFTLMYDIAKRVCPSLAERMDTLDLKQVGAIVELAGTHIAEVEEHPKSSKRRGVQPPLRN